MYLFDIKCGVVDEELAIKPGTRVGYIAINSLAISDEMWFLTADPVVCISMVLTEFHKKSTAEVSSRSTTGISPIL